MKMGACIVDIKEKINKLRKAKGWTKCELARKAGITPNTVYNWYNKNNSIPDRESIENVCAAFQITVAELYADIETNNFTEKEIRLLELFRKIPDNKKDKALSALELLID